MSAKPIGRSRPAERARHRLPHRDHQRRADDRRGCPAARQPPVGLVVEQPPPERSTPATRRPAERLRARSSAPPRRWRRSPVDEDRRAVHLGAARVELVEISGSSSSSFSGEYGEARPRCPPAVAGARRAPSESPPPAAADDQRDHRRDGRSATTSARPRLLRHRTLRLHDVPLSSAVAASRRPLLVLGQVGESEAFEQHPEVRLDRVDAEEDLLRDLAVGGRRGEGRRPRAGRARPGSCAGSPSASPAPGRPAARRSTRHARRGRPVQRCGRAEAEAVAVAKPPPAGDPLAVDEVPLRDRPSSARPSRP